MSKKSFPGGVCRLVLSVSVIGLAAACSSLSEFNNRPASYADAIAAAEGAYKRGATAEAVAQYEAAAKADPARKEPWLRIAQLRFAAGDYGGAITSAQAALQRDNTDPVATSLLAESGIRVFDLAAKAAPRHKQGWSRLAQSQFDARNYGPAIAAAQQALQRDSDDVAALSIMAVSSARVSAAAFDQLRQANAMGGDARQEALALARTIRATLGEPIFPAGAAGAAARSAAHRRAVDAAKSAASAPATGGTLSPRQTEAPSPAQTKRNPFDALKG